MRILIEQIILPFYRRSFFIELQKINLSDDINLIVGDSTTTFDTESHIIESLNVNYSKTRIIFNGAFYYVSGFFTQAMNSDVVVVTFSLRNLNYYLAIFLHFFIRKKVFLWGHISGRNRYLHFFRQIGIRLGSGFIAYTKTDAQLISTPYFGLTTHTSYLGNSLYSINEAQKIKSYWTNCSFNKINFIYSGRLISAKGVMEMIRAIKDANTISNNIVLHVVGMGTLEKKMKSFVDLHSLNNTIFFYGNVTEINLLSNLYNKSLFSLCCGYIGLNAIQSFMFGIPMIFKRDALHSPEIESCSDGFNSLAYSNYDELVSILVSSKKIRKSCASRDKIHSDVLEKYNTNLMALRMTQAFNNTNHDI